MNLVVKKIDDLVGVLFNEEKISQYIIYVRDNDDINIEARIGNGDEHRDMIITELNNKYKIK